MSQPELKAVAGDTDDETLLDKVTTLSESVAELKGTIVNLKESLEWEQDQFARLLDDLGMSKMDYESFQATGRLPKNLTHVKSILTLGCQHLTAEIDELLDAVGLSRTQYDEFRLSGKIDWDESALGEALNDIIQTVEETIKEGET